MIRPLFRFCKRMTEYLGNLKQFSVKTQNTIEDLTYSGHRVDEDVSAFVIVGRPNKMFSERKGDLIDQVFYYDGKTLTLTICPKRYTRRSPHPGPSRGCSILHVHPWGL